MQWSTDIRQMKAAIFDQAFIGSTWVSCPMSRVVAIRRRKGQLQVMIFGWGRWYNVEGVHIEGTGPSSSSREHDPTLLEEFWHSAATAATALPSPLLNWQRWSQ